MKKIAFVTFLIMTILVSMGASGSKETDSGMMEKPENTIMGSSRKVMYTDLKAASNYAENGSAVLFFNASWCPACQAALKDLNENPEKLSKGVTVIVVDYDTSANLKSKYGVTSQHTFVQIDAKGNKIKIWNGGKIDEINKQVKSM